MTSSSSINFKEMKVHILNDKDDLSSFECNKKEINDFIHDEAKQFQFERLGVSYVFTYQEEPVGFVTLSMADLRKEKLKSEDRLVIGKENYPALQISQLAVCVSHERKHIGIELCNFSLGKAYEFSERVGCRFLVLNAKRDAVGFYEKYGFKLLPKQEDRKEPVMFLNIFDKKY
jgi:predicted N-acetyltransferase YhbS